MLALQWCSGGGAACFHSMCSMCHCNRIANADCHTYCTRLCPALLLQSVQAAGCGRGGRPLAAWRELGLVGPDGPDGGPAATGAVGPAAAGAGAAGATVATATATATASSWN